MSIPRVLVVGDIVTDILAVHDGPIEAGSDTSTVITISGGGSAANTAAWLASLGVVVALAGVVGPDAAGTDRLTELMVSGVECSAVRQSDEASTGSIIVLAHARERSFLCDRAANLLLSPSDVDTGLSAGATHLHLSGYTLFDPASRLAGLHALAAEGVTTSVDAASAAPLRRVGGAQFLSWVRGTDLLLANLDEARTLLDDPRAEPVDLARRLAMMTTRAIVKLGPAGAIMAGPDGVVVVPAVVAESVVDPTGAGDAFAAGFLSEWLAGASPATALAEAARLGAIAVAHPGGRPLIRHQSITTVAPPKTR